MNSPKRFVGKFITLEGVEGTGKTTQCALLAEYLRGQGIDVLVAREPGGTAIGEAVRQILLSPAHSDLTYLSEMKPPGEQIALFSHSTLAPIAELLLFLAARAQLVEEIIRPALEAGKWVLCDRFSDATMAYQGYGREIPKEKIVTANKLATGGLRPDITILLDLDVDIGIRRAVSAKREFAETNDVDRMENLHKDFHRRVREGYLTLAEQEPERIKTVHVSGSIEDIHELVVTLIEPFFAKAK